MKGVLYLIHIPMMIVGCLAATIVIGFMKAYEATYIWWED